MHEQLLQFLESPNRENFLAIREEVIQSELYDPYSDECDQAGDLFELGKLEEARNVLQKGMGNLILSPRAHQFLSFLFHKLGDEQSARVEMLIGHACIEGMLASGNGSEASPYMVLRTSDEYDIIESLEKEFRQQSLVPKGEKHFDVVECTDGSTFWFDVTDSYNRLTKLLEP
jgi:hypothetical protein